LQTFRALNKRIC